MALAGLVQRPSPRKYHSGGTVRRFAGGGPAGPGGDMPEAPPPPTQDFTPSGGLDLANAGYQYGPGSMVPSGGGTFMGDPNWDTGWASSIQPAAGDPLGGWYSAGRLRDQQNALRMAADPAGGPAGAGGAPPRFTPTAAQQQFMNSRLPQESYFVGSELPSTDNWRLLPPPYNTPQYRMRNGRIIDTSPGGFYKYAEPSWSGNVEVRGSSGGSGAQYGYPFALNWGKGGQEVFWPGDISGQKLITSKETDKFGGVVGRWHGGRVGRFADGGPAGPGGGTVTGGDTSVTIKGPQDWPDPIGAPFQYSGAGPGGGGGSLVGGNMSEQDFIAANKGPTGFYTADEMARIPTGPPVAGAGPSDMRGIPSGRYQPTLGTSGQDWLLGTYGLQPSTNNPKLMAAMGYPASPFFPESGNVYPYGRPPNAFGGSTNLGQWIMRQGHKIFIPGSENFRANVQNPAFIHGPGFGYPVGIISQNVAYPTSVWFWPGQQENPYAVLPNVT